MKLIKNIITLTFLCLVSSKKTENNEDVKLSFSLPSGFYDEKSITLEIISNIPGATIYYTLDGHNPTENSTVYNKALTLKNKSEEENVYCMIKEITIDYPPPQKKINKANIVRAIAKLPDGTFSEILSGSYFVGLNKKELYGDLPVVSLITDPDNLFDYEKGIYVLGKKYDEWLAEDPNNINAESYQITGNFFNRGREYERPATFQYIPAHNTTVDLTQDLGIRIKGKASRTYFQKNFRLISRAEYGKKNIKYDLIPGNQRADGKGPLTKYKSFSLRNGGNDNIYTKFRDNLLQELIANDIFENQQNDLSIVFVDGEYWGIYYIYEELDEHYISNNYDIDDKDVAIIKNGKNIEAGDENDLNDYIDTMNFISENDMSIEANYEKAKKLLDVEAWAWATAFYSYIKIQDGWFNGNNYAVWRTNKQDKNVAKADGRWHLLMFDIEYSCDIYSGGVYYVDNLLQDNLNADPKTQDIVTKVAASLLKSKEYKNMFVNALCDVNFIIFNKDKVNKRVEYYREKILPLISEAYDRYQIAEVPKEDGPVVFYNTQVDNLLFWFDHRYDVMLDQYKEFFNFEPAVKVTVTANNFKNGSILMNNFSTLTEEYTGQYFKENIIYVTGKPAAGKKLKSWTLNKCKLASKNKKTIGVYPKKGCTIRANFA